MADAWLVDQARAFFGRLEAVAAAQPLLRLFDRAVVFRVAGEPLFHVSVRAGRLRVASGQTPPGPDNMVFETDADALAGMMRGQLRFVELGAGVTGRLRCVEGPGFYPDLSWVAKLIRLAQEHRL